MWGYRSTHVSPAIYSRKIMYANSSAPLQGTLGMSTVLLTATDVGVTIEVAVIINIELE